MKIYTKFDGFFTRFEDMVHIRFTLLEFRILVLPVQYLSVFPPTVLTVIVHSRYFPVSSILYLNYSISVGNWLVSKFLGIFIYYTDNEIHTLPLQHIESYLKHPVSTKDSSRTSTQVTRGELSSIASHSTNAHYECSCDKSLFSSKHYTIPQKRIPS